MKLMCLVNEPLELEPSQATTMLIHGARQRGHEVHVVGVTGLSLSPQDRVLAQALRVPEQAATREQMLAMMREQAALVVDVSAQDVLLLRTNPARDVARAWAHRAALTLAGLARDAGVRVLSDPDGLERASNKLYLSHVPVEFRPRTLVTRSHDAVREFMAQAGGAVVLKPLQGTWGQDVYKVNPQTRENFNQIMDVLTRQGYLIAQDFIPEAVDGDCRLLLMEGELLEHEGLVAAVQRVPGADDFRSNIHAGGRAEAATITPTMRAAVAATGPLLRKDGIFLAGLDFIGGKLVEINAYSPGGFGDAQRFTGHDFIATVLERVESMK